MLRTRTRRAAAGGAAVAIAVAGLVIGQGAAHAGAPLPVSEAGPVALWGPGGTAPFTMPAPTAAQASEAFTKVVASGEGSAVGLTAAGKVELIGTNPFASIPQYAGVAIPASLASKTTVDIAGATNGYGDGMAVTSDGQVVTWATGVNKWSNDLPTAAQLQGSTAAAISGNGNLAAVVKKDGSVLVWGETPNGDFGQTTPPAGLTGVTSVYFNSVASDVYALTSDGTLAAWGDDTLGETDLPTVTTETTDSVNVTDVATVGESAVALLSDGTLTAWGDETGAGGLNAPPAATAGKDIVALAANTTTYLAVDSTGTVYSWGQGVVDPAFTALPAGVDPANITGLSMNDYYATAIQATLGYLTKPTISGTAKVGQTLTAKAATFTATPDSTAGQWLANGAAIAGATGSTLKLTTAQVGKTITYADTATKGTETAKAISNPTAKVAALQVASTTSMSAPATTYGNAAHVTVTVRGGTTATGSVRLAGAGATQTRSLSGGKVTFTLPKTLAVGSHTLTASYAGNSTHKASSHKQTIRINKRTANKPGLKITSKPSRTKTGKATITTSHTSGLATPSGKVTVTLKLGGTTKKIGGTLKSGKATVTLPKLPKKGTWSVSVRYNGNGTYNASTSATVKVVVK